MNNIKEFPNPEDYRGLTPNGSLTNLTLPTDKCVNSMYWQRQNTLIAALLIIPSIILLIILLAESDILNLLWVDVLGLIGIV